MTEARLPWRVPAALAATQIVHWGSLFYAFSVLMPAMAAEMGWPRESVAGAFSAGLLAQAGAALVVGPLLDRIGARAVMTAGSLAAGLGLVLVGQVQTIAQLYAVWVGLGLVMAATLYEAAFAAVTAAFGAGAARRGIALVVFAGGLASTLAWPLTALLVETCGWRAACAALGAVNAACAPVHLLLPGRAPPPRHDGAAEGGGVAAALRQPRFWALALVQAAMGVMSSAIAVHLLPLLQERGMGGSAALIASLVGVAQVLGRVVEFAGGGRWSLRGVGFAALALLLPAFALLATAGSEAPLAGAVLLFGAANGVLTVVRGAIPAALFGTRHYGAVSGALAAFGSGARAFGPVGVALLWQQSGGYALPMAVLAVLALFAALLFAAAARPRRA